jgi:hypothetical protein
MQPNDGNTKVKFMLRTLEKIHVGSEKNHSGSTTLVGIKKLLMSFKPSVVVPGYWYLSNEMAFFAVLFGAGSTSIGQENK